jgi:uncharacterized protein
VISEELELKSSDGLSLEGVLDSSGTPGAAFLLCHPHPRMGGTMNAPLLIALRDALVARRWAVLRFNFRGIGRSEGSSALGVDETADGRGGLALLRERFRTLPLAIGGWSFGAAVAVRVACQDDALAACVAIAPSISPKEDVTAGIPSLDECRPDCPTLVITGANDDQVSPAECRAWAEQIDSARYVEVPAANHFFWARYEVLASAVTTFLDEAFGKER